MTQTFEYKLAHPHDLDLEREGWAERLEAFVNKLAQDGWEPFAEWSFFVFRRPDRPKGQACDVKAPGDVRERRRECVEAVTQAAAKLDEAASRAEGMGFKVSVSKDNTPGQKSGVVVFVVQPETTMGEFQNGKSKLTCYPVAANSTKGGDENESPTT